MGFGTSGLFFRMSPLLSLAAHRTRQPEECQAVPACARDRHGNRAKRGIMPVLIAESFRQNLHQNRPFFPLPGSREPRSCAMRRKTRRNVSACPRRHLRDASGVIAYAEAGPAAQTDSYRWRLTPPAPLLKCALHSLWRRDIRAPRFLTSAFLKMALKGL